MNLPEKLIYLRKRNALSQMEVAEKLNVSRQAVSRWETGAAIPSLENFKCLCNLFDVTLDYLFDEKQESQSPKLIGDKKEEEIDCLYSTDTKIRGKKIQKWAAAIIALSIIIIGSIVAIGIYVRNLNDGNDLYPIEETQKEAVETKGGEQFDINW